MLCEAHHSQLQNYLRAQLDKSASYDMLQSALELIQAICEDSAAMDMQELLCIHGAVAFLIEAMQGPCEENQEQLCTSGLVELLMKLLPLPFSYLQYEQA